MRVEIVSSRIVEMVGVTGRPERHILTTYRTDTGLTDTIDLLESEFSEERLWAKIEEQVKHASKIVGQVREIG